MLVAVAPPIQNSPAAASVASPPATGKTSDGAVALSGVLTAPAAGTGTVSDSATPTVTVSTGDSKDSVGASGSSGGKGFEEFESWLQKADAMLTAPAPTNAAPVPVASGTAAATQIVSTSIPVPVDHPAWGEALGHQVVWSVGQGVQQVQIHVQPPDLGPVSVHLRMQDDKTDITFVSAHAVTREALETSIPRLREIFAQEGLNLSQASVQTQMSQGNSGDGRGAAQSQAQAFDADGIRVSGPADQAAAMRPAQLITRKGLVDDYA
jgi:flagellar hook-length control protein FliK